MESQRSLLIAGLLFVSFLLYQQWGIDNAPQQPPEIEQSITTAAQDIPTSSAVATHAINKTTEHQTITVVTDLIQLSIDTLGGDIVESSLLAYPVEMDSVDNLKLLEQLPNYTFVAQSGLIGANGPDADKVNGRPQYQTTQNKYVLEAGQDYFEVILSFTNSQGITFDKVFGFSRDSYKVDVSYRINNTSDQNIQLQMYAQLKQSIDKPTEESNMMMQLYRGGAFSVQDDKYSKYDFGDMADANLKELTTGGWVAMLQHYFVTAWIPNSEQDNRLYSSVIGEDFAAIGFKSQQLTIAPKSTGEITAALYTGPKLQDRLEKASPYLDLTVDYGFLWWLAKPLHWLMTFFYGLVGNWGFAIIMLTFVVRGAMYPLSKKQYVSMAKMRQLQPKMAALKERFGDDRQKMGQATMELYKKEQVNPLGGCLPLLFQMPIFIGLFWMLQESVELRHAPFMLWINDLSALDPYYVLPILMGASMWFMSKMQPSMSTDPMQQKMMQFMPIIFTVFFLWFPSGLVLYWVTSNIVTLIQQTIIFRQIEKQNEKSNAK
ncbi:MAG: membrane protein insertase YidC [Gammaproteobacteria bacterium]|nr:membrane protein insertase YidC [Gammaproteobacteria bacterium]